MKKVKFNLIDFRFILIMLVFLKKAEKFIQKTGLFGQY